MTSSQHWSTRDVDADPLSDQILRNIFSLFITAGNDTTKNTTTHAFKLFSDNPDQWLHLVSDRDALGPAIEEMIRCATPVIRFGRTATTDTVLGGVDIVEGDAVVMYYESANRDESVFQDPENFDIMRNPNPHVGFGGGGPHFCLGAHLARLELSALFARLAERVTAIETGEPSYIVSDFFNGIKGMPVKVVAADFPQRSICRNQSWSCVSTLVGVTSRRRDALHDPTSSSDVCPRCGTEPCAPRESLQLFASALATTKEGGHVQICVRVVRQVERPFDHKKSPVSPRCRTTVLKLSLRGRHPNCAESS